MSKTLTVRSPLAHPWWWAALALLVLNDHFFKGSGLLPPGVTGKLSDFAGLVVAPPLLCALVSARTRGARLACTALVALGFACLKLVPGWAQGVDALLFSLGMPSRIVPDPTDLLALPALGLAWHAMEHPVTAQRVFVRAACSLALLACMATSQLPRPQCMLYNHRYFALDYKARILPCQLEDGTDIESLTRELRESDFEPVFSDRVTSQAFGLDHDLGCGAWLTIGDAFEGVVLWDGSHGHNSLDPITHETFRDVVTVEGTRTKLRVTVGQSLELLPAPDRE